MKLVNTRNTNQSVEFSEAILSPMGENGGLFAPLNLPLLDESFWQDASTLTYKKFALKIIEKFEFDTPLSIFENALEVYDEFDEGEATHIVKQNDRLYINELWHGKTRAFKDMALAPFAKVVAQLAEQKKERYLVICATSGDTGPATLSAFGGVKNTKVFCLYPAGKTSEVQRLQMVTAAGKNVKSLGIVGNFDDAQRELKTLLSSKEFATKLAKFGYKLNAANSVNFGRILFQILYHAWASVKLGRVDIIVPSGNFGDALGAFYAKKMGANIDKIFIASNANNVLTDFFKNGIYDVRNRKLKLTMSPAMDILVSSNIERLLFGLFGDKRTAELMANLKQEKFYELTDEEKAVLKETFEADFCDDDECAEAIKKTANSGRLIDPHTATCFKMVSRAQNTCVITSTAHWVKFTPSMVKAIKDSGCEDEFSQMHALSHEFGERLPKQITDLFEADLLHEDVVEVSQVEEKILNFVK